MYWSVEGETFPQPACNIRVEFSEEKRVISPDYYIKHICQIPSLFRCVLLAIFSRLPLLILVNFNTLIYSPELRKTIVRLIK